MDPFIFHLNEAAAKGKFFGCYGRSGYFTPDEVRAEYGKAGFNPMDWYSTDLRALIRSDRDQIEHYEKCIIQRKKELAAKEAVLAKV